MADRVPKGTKGVARWRAGQAPKWAEGDDAVAIKEEDTQGGASRVAPSTITHDASDRRLRRLAEGRREGTVGSEAPRRRQVEAAIVEEGDNEREEVKREPVEQSSSEEEDEDALEARRERLRAAAKARAAARENEPEEEAELQLEDEEQEPGSDSSWEYETDSEEEEERKLVKPVFVSKASRATMEERAKIDQEYEEEEAAKSRRAEARKKETRELVAAELVREQQAALARSQRAAREDTDSDGNEEEEYEKWRLRELKRIKRDKEERQKHEIEQAEVDRRRGMSDAQVMAEDAQMGKNAKKTRAQMVFMQKYHHKGAFFMENDEKNQHKEAIYNRDTNQALESDRNTAFQASGGPYDGSKVFQVRRGQFGKMGQTKWTHLTNEDTSKQDSPWAAGDESIRKKMQARMGGVAKR
jgi:microfibrillar-associated protein 1